MKKDLDKFTGKNTTCNACLEKGRRWRAKNPDKVKAKWAEYYEENLRRRGRKRGGGKNPVTTTIQPCHPSTWSYRPLFLD